MEFHYEFVSPSSFQCRARFWLANLLLDLICFLDVSLMVLAFKEPAGTVCHSFEAFSRFYIALELEMISFLPTIFKFFFRVAGFAHLLRIFSCFYSHF